MVELVTRNYWWPGVTKEVKQYMEGCNQCQRMKNRAEMPAGKLRPNKVSKKPWQYISVNLIMKLLVSKSYDLILVVYNRFSKMLYFVVTIEKITAEELVRLFRDNVWKLYGLLESVILNRRSQFVVGLMRKLNKMLGDRKKIVYGLSPTDRWTDREDKLGAGAVLKDVCQS